MGFLFLFGSMLIVMLLRIAPPLGVRLHGEPVGRVSLGMRERVRLQRTNIYAIGVVLLVVGVTEQLPLIAEIAVMLGVFGILAIPARYVITTRGIALNHTVFREWSDFASVDLESSGIRLSPGATGGRPFRLVLAPDKSRELARTLRKFVGREHHPVVEVSAPMTPAKRRPRRNRLPLLTSLSAFLLVAMLSIGAVSVFAAGDPQPDPSGIQTGSGADLAGIAPGTLTTDDFDSAARTEPFALKLADMVNQNRLGVNFTWTLVAGFLVMFMQAGFALVETGFCRAKNAAHTMTMNFMIYVLGLTGYFICGFAFQEGGIGLVGVSNLGGLAVLNRELTIPIGGIDWGLIGWKGFFLSDGTYDVGVAVMFLFQMVFMDTTATIPTGAMAERWKWSAFCIYGLFISAIVYPIFGNWAWGGGWLSQLGKIGLGAGYADFAGSGVVHAIGGWSALAGAMVLGPRLGKYNKDGSANPIPGHNLVLGLLGCFILAFGWFGFNPGSTLGASGNGNLRIGMVAVATMLASASAAIVAMVYTWIVEKKPNPAMMANGLLAGLVAITAPSGFVSPFSGFIIGAIAGVLVCVAIPFFDRLKADDPVGAISVHGVNGLWGQIAVGLFADGSMNYGGTVVRGLFFGDAGQLVAQLIGGVVAFAWAFGACWVFFTVQKAIMGLRVSEEVELRGLDLPEMGMPGDAPDAEPYRGAFPIPADGALQGAPVGV